MSSTPTGSPVWLPSTTKIKYENWTSTDSWIVYYWFLLVLILLIMLLQCVGSLYQGDRLKSRNRQSLSFSNYKESFKISAASLLLISLYVAYIGNFIGVLITLARLSALKPFGWTVTAGFCKYTYAVNFCATATVKVANYVFFTYRAKLAQGLNTILEDKWFDVIIPVILFVLWVSELVFIISFPLPGKKVTSDDSGRDLCVWNHKDLEPVHYVSFGLLVIIDTSSAIFFLYLFGKPLQSILKAQNTKSMRSVNLDSKNKKKNFKLITTIRINFACSILTTASSVFVAWTFWSTPSFLRLAWAGIGDYAWNSFCCFIMLASNRRLLLHSLCCFKNRNVHQRLKTISPVPKSTDIELSNIESGGTDQPNVSGNSSANSSINPNRGSFSNYSNISTANSRKDSVVQQLPSCCCGCCDDKLNPKTIQFYNWLRYVFCPTKCYILVFCCRNDFGLRKYNDKKSMLGRLFDPPVVLRVDSVNSNNSSKRDTSKHTDNTNHLGSIDENEME